MFDSPDKMLLGLVTGIVFGFLLQKGQVAKFETIVGQLLLRDWTVTKIMLTAIAVGSVGVYVLAAMGAASLHIKPALIGGVLAGAGLFGVGLAMLGYCPGTTVAACGAGHRDAFAGLAGMFLGASLYVWLFAALKPLTKAGGDWGKITLPEVSGTSAWPWIAAVAGLTVLMRLTVLRTGADSGSGSSSPRRSPSGS